MLIKMLGMRAAVGALLIVSASGCVGGPSLRTAINCAALIPPSIREPVEDVEPPAENTVGAWVATADARSGKLDEANRNTAFLADMADACQAEQGRLARSPPWMFWR